MTENEKINHTPVTPRTITSIPRPCTPFKPPRKKNKLPEEEKRSFSSLDDEEEDITHHFGRIIPKKSPFFFSDDEDEDEDEEKQKEKVSPICLDGDDDDDDDDDIQTQPLPISRRFCFIENKNEAGLVTSPSERRPNEIFIHKLRWSREDINQFLGADEGIGYTPDQIETIIELSKKVQMLKRKILADLDSLQETLIDFNEFHRTNFTHYYELCDTLQRLYSAELSLRQHVILILIPDNKPRFIAADLPPYLPLSVKKRDSHALFMPKYGKIKRVVYWVNIPNLDDDKVATPGSDERVPINTFEPCIKPCDTIFTAFMARDWKLERIFSIPEYY